MLRALLLSLLLCTCTQAQSAERVEQELETAYRELHQSTAQLREEAGDAEARALCERACARYVWVLDQLDALSAERRAQVEPLAHYNIGCGQAVLGRSEIALGALESAVRSGFSDWRGMQDDADLQGLRADVRFKRLVRGVWVEGTLSDLYVLGWQLDRALEGGQYETAYARAETALERLEPLYASSLSTRTAQAQLRYQQACARARQGRQTDALRLLEQALETGLVDPLGVSCDDDLSSLRPSLRFSSLVADHLVAWGQRPREAAPLELDWTWTFTDDLNEAGFAQEGDVMRVWARTLWRVSEGTVCLRRVTLRDQAEQVGELHTPRGLIERGMLSDETYAMTNLGVLWIPGRCGAFTFVHEVGHLLFWLPEEYDTPGGCPCAQAGERGRLTWCDDDSHSKEQRALGKESCWTQILRRYPQLRHPGPGGAQPELELTIDDR